MSKVESLKIALLLRETLTVYLRKIHNELIETLTINHPPPSAGFLLSGYPRQSGSPEAHQNFMGSTPELRSGVHQKGCDLEGVEGATPQTQLTHLSPLKQ